jgi:hypothetical protein
MAATAEEFLVRVDEAHFVVDLDGREVAGTDVPSCAKHLSYVEADRLCQALRKRRFKAVVTDLTGRPVTAYQLKQTDSLPATVAALDRLPAAELKRRMKSDAHFRQRVFALWGGVAFEI